MNIFKRIVLGGLLSIGGWAFASELPNFTKLIKENAKTVVQIKSRTLGNTTSGQSKIPSPHSQMMPEDLFKYFFGEGEMRPMPKRPTNTHGSGFFIDDQGYVLTGTHVVKNGDEITVSTTDQKEYVAELIGMDERTDVALLKINKKGTPAIKIGDSDKLEVGDWVLAIGSPFGFDYTATKGIVSAVSRSLPDGAYVPFIQTDAAVNPGSSGGPLFNLKGEVVGMNSQIYSRTGFFNGLSFAIPINTAMHIAEQLKTKGFASRGWLGVGIQHINQGLADSFGLDSPKGALIASISPDSPAEKAGLEVGDIILQFDGKKINKSSNLPPLVGAVNAGKKVSLDIIRLGKKKTINTVIGELDEGHSQASNNKKTVKDRGIAVKNLNTQQKTDADLDYGVIVTKVDDNSKADKAGFRRGDIIVSIDNKKIKDVKAFRKALKNKDDKTLAVLLIRQERSLFIPL